MIKKKGFSLIEVVIGMALVGIALLGLAQIFTLSMMNNVRSDNITHATFLAQQRIDFLRNLTTDELGNYPNPRDEQIDINNDGIDDFRRITVLQDLGNSRVVIVLIFSATEFEEARDALIGDPHQYRVRANISTIISR